MASSEVFYALQYGTMDSVTICRIEDGRSVPVVDISARTGASKLNSWDLAEKIRALLNSDRVV